MRVKINFLLVGLLHLLLVESEMEERFFYVSQLFYKRIIKYQITYIRRCKYKCKVSQNEGHFKSKKER